MVTPTFQRRCTIRAKWNSALALDGLSCYVGSRQVRRHVGFQRLQHSYSRWTMATFLKSTFSFIAYGSAQRNEEKDERSYAKAIEAGELILIPAEAVQDEHGSIHGRVKPLHPTTSKPLLPIRMGLHIFWNGGKPTL